MMCHCLLCGFEFQLMLQASTKPEFNAYMKARSIKLGKDQYVECPQCRKTYGIEKSADPEASALIEGSIS